MVIPAIVACLSLAAAGSQRLGLAMSVPEGAGEEEYIAAIRTQIRLGLDGCGTTIKWDEYEAQKGKPLTDFNGVIRITNQETLVTISTIDTIKRRLPADVSGLKWDSPEMLARFDAFLREIAPRLDKRVKWISLGNEVDGYLRAHPDEIDAYIRFLAHSRGVLKGLKPEIQVGVTITCMDSLKSPELAKRLIEGMDIAILTYYPLDGMRTCELSEIPSHFAFMSALAGAKPLVLQEIGYPSSPLCNSSEEKQAGFVKAVFAQLDRLGAKVPLALYFLQSDFPPSVMKVLEQYYGLSDPKFLAYLKTLGLTDDKGKPKLAWKTFRSEVSKRKPID